MSQSPDDQRTESSRPVWPELAPAPSPNPSPSPETRSAPVAGRSRPLAPDGVETRAAAALAAWRTRLLDLTKRNRALNFRPTKVSTVAIVDEQPAEVYRHLCTDGRPMRFRPTLPSARKDGGDVAGAVDEAVDDASSPPAIQVAEPTAKLEDGAERLISADDGDAPQATELDFAPYDPEALDERHTDDVLQALATPEALDKSLRRLDEQARATIEEQGVNVLFLGLGMLHYSESAESQDVLRAPLVMVPVTLSRKSARTGYAIQATDEDPMVNPALAEHLRRSFGIALPVLPSSEEGNGGPNLQGFYQAVAEIAAERVRAGFKGWAVKTDIFLGLFSFQKLVMFKDMEAHADAFAAHDMVRQLISREAAPGTVVMGLPEDVRQLELDQHFPPERTAQVVDADSSQLRAIAAVSRGHPLVLEGPPGTGKSQTITNLIAQALAEGKSVLFVAEKMAALQVVYSRLVSAGLGEFCLELHASKANKRAVMHELKAALDASLQRPVVEQRTHRLPHVRAELTEYARAVHERYGALGISPYAACGMLDRVLDAPRLPLKAPIDALTREALSDTEHLLQDLAVAVEPVGIPSRHAWRDTARTFYTPGALEDLRRDLIRVAELLEQLVTIAEEVERDFALPPIRTAGDVKTAAAIAAVLHDSPGAPLAVLESDAWNAPPAEATELVESVKTLQRWREQIGQRFTDGVLDQEHAADIAHVELKASGMFGFLAVLDGRFRAIKRRWTGYRKPGYSAPLIEQANDLKLVDRYLKARESLEGRTHAARALFGALWQGERSSIDALERYIGWVVEVRGVCVRHGLSTQALTVATTPSPDVRRVTDMEQAAAALAGPLAALSAAVQWPEGYAADAPLAEVLERVRAMSAAVASAPAWATFEQARRKAAASPAKELVALAMRNTGTAEDVPFGVLATAFRRAVLERFLEQVMGERAALREFRTLSHEQRLKEFRQLDEWVLRENRARVVGRLREATQQRLQTPEARAGLPFVQREMAKQRNLAPLRRTLQQAEATVRAIKPCFLMSPLTVAQYLDGTAPSFDLVIFDEASQLPSEDAIGAIARGKQLVVVGDPKQLPPTNFFTTVGGATAPVGEDGLPLVEDSESVLEEYMGAGVPVTRLKWHYRSAHESLITFSNVSFYDADLYTFPSVETHSETSGLSFEYVEDGVYEGKGLNMAEARRVVDAVVRHAKERPHESLGVGTFNLRQQLAILDELELRRRQDPSVEPFFSRGSAEPFFVKNLENIQGDERDVIFLSVTYAKGPDGRLRYNFGPINGENGWRRLNVLTTRARKRMRVFSSMRGDDINAAGTTSRGAHLLRDFLRYAEFGRLESVVASATAAAESPFESEVASELTRRGIKVVPQVGAAGYRIDIGVLDDEVPGRFVCGVECDGVAYHSAETARDRDRLRQQVLEARGWTIIRVWSADWFKDRQGQVARLLELIDGAKGEAKERIAAEAEAETRARELAEAERRESVERQASVEAETLARVRAAVESGPYVRPTVPAYAFAGVQGKYADAEFLDAPTSHVAAVIAEIIGAEAPMHADDLASRTAAAWGVARVGSRISAKVHEALRAAVRGGAVVERGDFLWSPALAQFGAQVPVRSRAGTRITGDRVPPEEVQEAIRLVLRAAGGMTRDELLSEVRQVLGVGKAAFAPRFEDAMSTLLRDGAVGEGSAGYALRG